MKIAFEIPIKTVSEMNSSEHWTKKAKRHKQQQLFTRLAFRQYMQDIKLPCEIKISRLAPRLLDDDNLPPALKYIKDEIASLINPSKVAYYVSNGRVKCNKGHSDNDPRITWVYGQEKNKMQLVSVEISF